MKIARLLFLAAALGLLAYGLFRELHPVRKLDGAELPPVRGGAFVAGATYEAFVRKDGALYDANSLEPGSANVKDCKT